MKKKRYKGDKTTVTKNPNGSIRKDCPKRISFVREKSVIRKYHRSTTSNVPNLISERVFSTEAQAIAVFGM